MVSVKISSCVIINKTKNNNNNAYNIQFFFICKNIQIWSDLFEIQMQISLHTLSNICNSFSVYFSSLSLHLHAMFLFLFFFFFLSFTLCVHSSFSFSHVIFFFIIHAHLKVKIKMKIIIIAIIFDCNEVLS